PLRQGANGVCVVAGERDGGYARRQEDVGMVSTFQPTTAEAAVQGLPQVFDPSAAEGVEAVLLFDLGGREPGQGAIVIRGGPWPVMPGARLGPTVALSLDSH